MIGWRLFWSWLCVEDDGVLVLNIMGFRSFSYLLEVLLIWVSKNEGCELISVLLGAYSAIERRVFKCLSRCVFFGLERNVFTEVFTGSSSLAVW